MVTYCVFKTLIGKDFEKMTALEISLRLCREMYTGVQDSNRLQDVLAKIKNCINSSIDAFRQKVEMKLLKNSRTDARFSTRVYQFIIGDQVLEISLLQFSPLNQWHVQAVVEK